MESNSIICPSCKQTDHIFFCEKNTYKLYKCQFCTLVFVDPIPSEKELNDFYQNYHKTSQYTGKIESKQRRAKKRIKSVKRLVKGTRFIDIGCNAGFAVEAARTLGLYATGIDLDKASIEFAQDYYPKAKFLAISIEELAEKGESFDIIYCSEVIEHLPRVDDFIEALYKILHKDGVIFLTTPDIGHYSIAKKLVNWDAIRPPEHLLYFSKKSLGRLLQKKGFSYIKFKFNFKPTLKVILRK